jgi:hypothetical protein
LINVTAFEAEITDEADVFIGPRRGVGRMAPVDGDEPFLFVVLPSFSFKVRLSAANLALLRSGAAEWLPEGDN